MFRTVVALRDGGTAEETWPGIDSPAAALTAAVVLAELQNRGEPHAGAWLYIGRE